MNKIWLYYINSLEDNIIRTALYSIFILTLVSCTSPEIMRVRYDSGVADYKADLNAGFGAKSILIDIEPMDSNSIIKLNQLKNKFSLEESIEFSLIIKWDNGDSTIFDSKNDKGYCYVYFEKSISCGRIRPKYKFLGYGKGEVELTYKIIDENVREIFNDGGMIHMYLDYSK